MGKAHAMLCRKYKNLLGIETMQYYRIIFEEYDPLPDAEKKATLIPEGEVSAYRNHSIV